MFQTAANFLAFHVVASFAFGAPSGFIEKAKDKHNLVQIVDARGEYMNAIGSLSSTLRSNIKYNPFDDSWTAGPKARAGLESIGRAAYERRKESGGDSRKDLLSFLFSAKDPDTSQPIPENEIIAESISFVVGGSDTISSTRTNFIDFIARDAGQQTRIQQEVDLAFPGQPIED